MKFLKSLILFALVAACAPPIIETAVQPIGDFALGHNIVMGDKMVKGPLSRTGDPKKISDAVQAAIGDRLSKYDGDKRYHVITRIDAYTLGRIGIPLIFSPQTALVVNVSVWDDAAQKRLNENPVQLLILENTNKANILGSGIGQTREQQIASIAKSAAFQIEDWLRKQNAEQGWFDPKVKVPLFDIISLNKTRSQKDGDTAQ
jgi:hypothetical protein